MNQKKDFPPVRVGRRLVILPAWDDSQSVLDRIPIRLDSGTAFGNGEHPTTQLCLAAVERHLRPGAAMLDLGTGTGILAIAAAKLGAASVLAVDIDPEAVQIAGENLARNKVAGCVRVEQGSLEGVLDNRWGQRQFSLVIANILANVIVAMFDQGLTQVIAPDGLLVLSGILRSQTPDIRACLEWNGLNQVAQENLDDWVCVIAQRVGQAGL